MDRGPVESQDKKDTGDAHPRSLQHRLRRGSACRKRNRQTCCYVDGTCTPSIPETGAVSSAQSHEGGTLLLIFLENKTISFSGKNKAPFLVSEEIQPEFR